MEEKIYCTLWSVGQGCLDHQLIMVNSVGFDFLCLLVHFYLVCLIIICYDKNEINKQSKRKQQRTK